jgi:hypothetical protein
MYLAIFSTYKIDHLINETSTIHSCLVVYQLTTKTFLRMCHDQAVY